MSLTLPKLIGVPQHDLATWLRAVPLRWEDTLALNIMAV